MGYYTRFESGVTGPQELLNKLEEDAENGLNFGQYGEPIENFINDDLFGGDTAKWYNWESDLKNLSDSYPALLFTLKGEGEEAGDIWKAWARNGKVVRVHAKIVFDEPDLDVVLPTPDIKKQLEKIRADKLEKIQAKIDALQAEKESLLDS